MPFTLPVRPARGRHQRVPSWHGTIGVVAEHLVANMFCSHHTPLTTRRTIRRSSIDAFASSFPTQGDSSNCSPPLEGGAGGGVMLPLPIQPSFPRTRESSSAFNLHRILLSLLSSTRLAAECAPFALRLSKGERGTSNLRSSQFIQPSSLRTPGSSWTFDSPTSGPRSLPRLVEAILQPRLLKTWQVDCRSSAGP